MIKIEILIELIEVTENFCGGKTRIGKVVEWYQYK